MRESQSPGFVADPAAVYSFAGRFFATLVDSGVEHVVISPGSRSTPLAVVARQTRGLRSWIQLDERAAGFFALGLAKAGGQPVLLICTSGTAVANYLPAVIEAHYSRVPLILATADRPTELRDWGAGQTIDQLGIYGHYVRWTVEVPIPTAGEDVLRYATQLAARAVETARSAPAGAVHLNWPLREPLAPPVGRLGEILATAQAALPGPRTSKARSVAQPEDVAELVVLARSEERGVLCCGPSREDPARRNAIAAFSSAAGWPVLTDPASNLRSEAEADNAPILDMGDVLTRSVDFARSMRPAVVLRLGDTPVSKAQRLWLEASNPESIWWFDEAGQWGEPSHRVTRVIRGGGTSLLLEAAAELAGDSTGAARRERSWCRAFESSNAVARKAIDDIAFGEGGWSGLAIAATVARVAPSDAQLFVSNSMSIRLLDLGFANRIHPLVVHCNRGASGIDGVTSAALGTAAASKRPTVLLTGDLALLHDTSGLLIARRESIPLTIVVMDDHGGGIFSMLPIAAQGEEVAYQELFRTPHELDLAKLASLFELDYCPVRDLAELEGAIEEASDRAGVTIVHARLDSEANEATFRRAVAAGCDAVDAEMSR